jgi:hypothetical protein
LFKKIFSESFYEIYNLTRLVVSTHGFIDDKELKEIFYATPLLQNNEIKVDLKNDLLESSSYLRKDLEIMKIILETNQIMTEETVQNMGSISYPS